MLPNGLQLFILTVSAYFTLETVLNDTAVLI